MMIEKYRIKAKKRVGRCNMPEIKDKFKAIKKQKEDYDRIKESLGLDKTISAKVLRKRSSMVLNKHLMPFSKHI